MGIKTTVAIDHTVSDLALIQLKQSVATKDLALPKNLKQVDIFPAFSSSFVD